VFGKFVAEIADDISTNWSERWAFMQKVVKIQLLAVREIVSATFDDVWAVLKSGAVAYGKTLYEVFKKVFTDIAGNIWPWMRQGFDKGWDYLRRYQSAMKELRQEWFQKNPGRMQIKGEEVDELQAEARRRASIRVGMNERFGVYEQRYPSMPSEQTWADTLGKVGDIWKQTYDEMAEHTKKVFDTIKQIEKAAAGEIADYMPKAWKDKWAAFKGDLEQARKDTEAWYEDQKKIAKDAADEIAKATGTEGGLGGGGAEEPTTGKTASIVGIKEMWQRMVEGLSGGKELDELQKQTGILADIRNGKGPLGVTMGPMGPQIDRDIVRGKPGPKPKGEKTGKEPVVPHELVIIPYPYDERSEARRAIKREKEERDLAIRRYERDPLWHPVSRSVEPPRIGMPSPAMPNIRQAGNRTGGELGFRDLLKETRTMIDELRRIRAGVNKLEPIGAVGP